MPDLGLTHVALTARDLDASIAFYGKYAGMAVVHRRVREGVRSVWLSDHTRPFVIVLVEAAGQQDHPDISASLAQAGRRSIGYMPRPAARADRHALRSMRATPLAIPRGLPTPTAIRSSSPLVRRSGSPCGRRGKDELGRSGSSIFGSEAATRGRMATPPARLHWTSDQAVSASSARESSRAIVLLDLIRDTCRAVGLEQRSLPWSIQLMSTAEIGMGGLKSTRATQPATICSTVSRR